MDSRPLSISDQIRAAVLEAAKIAGFDLKLEDVSLEHPAAEEHGDYSTNIALKLARQLGQNPREVAEKIVTSFIRGDLVKVEAKQEFSLARGGLARLVEKIELAGPGFINFWLSEEWLLEQVGVAAESSDYGRSEGGKNDRVVVEYTDPNPFKELHIGHLVSNVTGESLARLQEAMGAVVWRADYFGDVGIHAAKSVWGLQQKMLSEKVDLETLAKRSLLERVKFMGEAYVLGTKKYDEDPAVKEQIGHLNTVLYIVAQRMWQKQGQGPVVDYDPEHKISQEEIAKVVSLFETGRQWSLDYFESIYQILGTKFDGYYPESRVGEVGYKYVLDNLGKVFEESDGAVVFRGEKFGLHTRVFINKHKLPTYEAKELGLAPVKYQDFPYNKSIIVVATEIKEYFRVLVEALKQVNPQLGNVTMPICTGMVRVPSGKMGSRFGNVITVLGLIGELKALVMPRLDREDMAEKEKDLIAQKVAVAAIKYAFLKSGIGQDIVFDLEKSLSFEGDSGPYLQYTFARARSVIRKSESQRTQTTGKSENSDVSDKSDESGSLSSPIFPEELAVLRYLYRFPEVVEQAAKNYAPNLVCSYLFELAKRFNNFYSNCPIISGDQNLTTNRLALTISCAQVLKNGLGLLGIEALERM